VEITPKKLHVVTEAATETTTFLEHTIFVLVAKCHNPTGRPLGCDENVAIGGDCKVPSSAKPVRGDLCAESTCKD
ncbi:MAG: hypothetical protein MJB57_11665, partial [Gemmatimonadetes bacterium]|nr:hypothetical protein [Gemmatimonadota bacterium]